MWKRIKFSIRPLFSWLDWTVDVCIDWLPEWLEPFHILFFVALTMVLLPAFLVLAIFRMGMFRGTTGQ